MKRLHVHVSVEDIAQSVGFYSTLFAAEPAVLKPDYAKWMLDDPRVNFAISARGGKAGLDHFGIQVETQDELQAVYGRLRQADRPVLMEGATTCCYAKVGKGLDHRPAGSLLGNLPHIRRQYGLWRQCRSRRGPHGLGRPGALGRTGRRKLRAGYGAGGRGALLRSDSTVSVTIYHNPACGTSRNVLALIRNTGVDPDIVEYLKNPPSRDELESLIGRMGIGVRALLRRQGTPYDALNLDDPALTDGALIDAMLLHPILINRPIVVTPKGVALCRPSEAVLDILPDPQRGPFAKEDGDRVIDAGGRRIEKAQP
jgi:arsenate reductase